MAIFSIPATLIQPGAERRTAPRDPPDRCKKIRVELIDTNTVWNTTPGNILRWGIQASAADGAYANDATDWQNPGSVFQDNLPFGSRRKDGGMPTLLIDADPEPVALPGVRLRLAIQVDTAITLGAEVRTNADV